MTDTSAALVDTSKPIVIGSRASQLAQIQTNIVLAALREHHPQHTFDVSLISTAGDKNQSQALYLLGGKSLWTKELEVALLDGEIDLIVHSLKDVPTTLPDGCEVGAILEREDPSDCLVMKQGLQWKTLEELPDGSVIGTSSVRRVAQLRRAFPKLVFQDVRGNLNTRLAKLDDPAGPYTALILAQAGLVRLGFGSRVTSALGPPTLYHAVGQAALAIEVRKGDEKIKTLVSGLIHWRTEWLCRAERACLRVLEGGCSVPVGVRSWLSTEDEHGVLTLKLTGTVTSLTGDPHVERTLERTVSSAEDAEALGEAVAKELIENGARAILEEINRERDERKTKEKLAEEAKAFETAGVQTA